MLAILLHMLKGTPYIYQGEEIGMTNRVIQDISEAEDIESKNMYADRLQKGYSQTEILASINAKGRDNARTPMQWDETKNAGFTTGTPWLAVNKNYHQINVAKALADKNSVFYTYQKLIELRKNHPLMIWGSFELVENTTEEVFAYYRHYQSESWLIVCNFSDQEQRFSLDKIPSETIITNNEKDYDELSDRILEPYEAFVVKLSSFKG
ncbi:alpha-glucosidase C-terminal domain-containing protein [Enterococcus crotali]|uniref:alpha-amylase family glycosyl hydrolase n=1 Tax=Enterococcus crotali TaxID=1453587 RepID=UPI003B84543E